MDPLDYTSHDGTIFYSQRTLRQHSCSHMHDAYEILYLTEGTRYFFINDRAVDLKKGDVLIINFHTLHKAFFRPQVTCRGHLVYLYETNLISRLENLYLSDYLYLRPDLSDQMGIEEHFRTITGELEGRESGYEMLIHGEVEKLLVRLNRLAAAGNGGEPEFPDSAHEQVSAIVKYLSLRYSEELPLERIAGDFRLSPSYICRIFRRVTGYTLTGYIGLLRVREAKRLLRETDLSITRIGYDCGFGSIAHFGRIFRKTTGIAPREYRRIQ